MRTRQWLVFATFAASVVLLVSVAAQDPGQVREFVITGNNYSFSPASIQVNRNDLVKITFTAHDIAHSFTIDEYRIVKRASAGQDGGTGHAATAGNHQGSAEDALVGIGRTRWQLGNLGNAL